MANVKFLLQNILPARKINPKKDHCFVCYTLDSPIPWDQKIFSVKDEGGQNWLCHESKPISVENFKEFAQNIKKDYPSPLKRSSDIVYYIAIARAANPEELSVMLTGARFDEKS